MSERRSRQGAPGRLWMTAIFAVMMGLAGTGRAYAQEKFQRIGGGYYRFVQDVGLYVDLPGLYRYWTGCYADGAFTGRAPYSSIMPKKARYVMNVLNLPETLKKTIVDTLSRLDDVGKIHEFVFPFKGSQLREGYMLVVVYGQETWEYLDCAQAWFVVTE